MRRERRRVTEEHDVRAKDGRLLGVIRCRVDYGHLARVLRAKLAAAIQQGGTLSWE